MHENSQFLRNIYYPGRSGPSIFDYLGKTQKMNGNDFQKN